MATNNIPQSKLENFRRRGIKTKSQTERPIQYVGKSSGRTFKQMEDLMESRFSASDTDVAVLGEAYGDGQYRPSGGDRSYELAYGNRDWTAAAADSLVMGALSRAFGDNDDDPTGVNTELTKTDLQKALGRDISVRNSRDSKERFRVVLAAQNNVQLPRDEDTSGIRGVEDLEAKLEPLA